MVDCDDNLERSGKFERELCNIMAPYYELKKEFDRLHEQLIDADMHLLDTNSINDNEGELSPSTKQKIV